MKELKIDFLVNIICVLLSEIEKLTAENVAVREEKADLELIMEMSSEHADEIGSELREKVDASEQLFKEMLDLIPVPALLPVQKSGQIYYVNQQACLIFGYSFEEFKKYKVSHIYVDPNDRCKFLASLKKNGKVSDFEVKLKTADGTQFWGTLFSQTITFKDKPCLLTIVYDLSERKKAEQEIQRLNEELERAREREGKYLMFSLAGEEYGIDVMKIMEIIAIKPLTPIPEAPDHVKGILRLRNSLIPVIDLRTRFNLEPIEYNNRTCIIITDTSSELEKIPTGFIVDSVIEVMTIKGKNIEDTPELNGKTDFIYGIAKIDGTMKILLDIEKID